MQEDRQTFRHTGTHARKRADIQTYTNMHNDTDIQTYRRTAIQKYRRPNIQTDIHEYRYADVQAYRHSSAGIGHTRVQTCRSTPIQSHVQIYRHTGTQAYTHTDRNVTPESYEEVMPSYALHMADGALHMSDGSPALRKCAATLGLPHAAVVHGSQEYVRAVKFLKSSLSPKAKAAVTKKPACNSSVYYHTLAGDNSVEGLFGTCQQSRARANLHGRASVNNAHVNQLAACYFTHRPGLASVLRALAVYRKYASACMDPASASCRKAGGLQVETPWLGVAAVAE